MAADTFEAQSYKEPAVYGRGGSYEIVRCAKVDLDDLVGAAGSAGCNPLEANDVIKLFKLPPDVKMTYARVDSEDLDSGTTLTFDLQVTNGTTTKLFFDEAVVGQAAGYISTDNTNAATILDAFDTNSAIGYIVPDDNYYVAYKCSVAPTGAGAGDQIMVTVKYLSAIESVEGAFRS